MLSTIAGLERIGEENAFAVLARANELMDEGHDIINLGIGQPDFSTPEHIVEAAIQALRDGHHGYTPANGIFPLREAVAANIYQRLLVDISPDNVLIVPGGKVTMFIAILMFGASGIDILYPDPGFPIYRSMIEFTGARPVPIPIREEAGFSFRVEDIAELLTPQTRLIILNSPANPCGGVASKQDMDQLADLLIERSDIAILSDEIYSQILYDGREHVSLLSYEALRDRLILLDGWSKTYAMTGWRLGYSVWPDALYDKARKLAVNSWSCVNAATQWAGLAALQGPQDCVAKMVGEFDQRRKIIVDGLNAIDLISCRMPAGAFYAFANIKAVGQPAKTFARSLLEEAGVAVVGGPDFGTLGEGYVRFSYANSIENIERALVRLERYLA